MSSATHESVRQTQQRYETSETALGQAIAGESEGGNLVFCGDPGATSARMTGAVTLPPPLPLPVIIPLVPPAEMEATVPEVRLFVKNVRAWPKLFGSGAVDPRGQGTGRFESIVEGVSAAIQAPMLPTADAAGVVCVAGPRPDPTACLRMDWWSCSVKTATS